MEVNFKVVPPFDALVTSGNVRMILENLFFDRIREGAPLRMCFMNRADRTFGVPYLWHYNLYLEYHESPAIPVAIALEGFFALIALFGIIIATYALINSGVIEKIGDNIIVPAVTGIALVFILGIGFVVALSYFAPGVRATARPPHVPGAGVVPVTEVSVGPAAVSRRRG